MLSRRQIIEWAIRLSVALVLCSITARPMHAAETELDAEIAHRFQQQVAPILERHCFACHGDGANEGQVALDDFAAIEPTLRPLLWSRVLKSVRAGIMPPAGEERLSPEELDTLQTWIKLDALGNNPDHSDPGHVTLRRLNRHEYHYTILDLLDYDYDTQVHFPPDDSGHGFDNIGSLLNTPPMLVEKYLRAANEIVRAAVPSASRVVREQTLPAERFFDAERPTDRIVCREPQLVTANFPIDLPGEYLIEAKFQVYGSPYFGYLQTHVGFLVDGEPVHRDVYSQQEEKHRLIETVRFRTSLREGNLTLAFEVDPVLDAEGKKQGPSLTMRVFDVRIAGPFDESQYVTPPNYARYFPQPTPPIEKAERRNYARRVLRSFVSRAFRRPVNEATLDRLVQLAEATYSNDGSTFEQGIQQAMIATLSSRRFLYRVEQPAVAVVPTKFPPVDEYSLASRLSYLIWCSMPDEELLALAEAGKLRSQLAIQVERMLADSKSERFVENFVGQWLRTREVDTVEIDVRLVLARDLNFEADERSHRDQLNRIFLAERQKQEEDFLKGEQDPEDAEPPRSILLEMQAKQPPLPNVRLDRALRNAMRQETEACFAHVLLENRSLLELIDSDYTFLNERLAQHYGISEVKGAEMRKFELPQDSLRGGVLTHAGLLTITSQSTRTSAVKRGVFVLDNLLGTPAPPPPPDIPPLEDADDGAAKQSMTMREMLEWHRRNPACASCHARMDPIGFAMENFNALGMFRTEESGQRIDVSGELVTGETLESVDDLKKVLVGERRKDYYRCLTEKLLIYALGRGLEYSDTEAVDQIVARLEQDEGRAMSLVMRVIESVPFQKCRAADFPDPRSATTVAQ
ncbi:MAG: DUF1592 domain-containing protein [Pirellulaceae bacterium]